MGNDPKGVRFRRRDFMKATTFASIAAALPAAGFSEPSTTIGSKPSPAGKKRHLLFSSDDPDKFGKLIESIRFMKEYDFSVTPIKIDYQKLEESAKAIETHNADILVINLPGAGITATRIAEYINDLDIPVIIIPTSPDLIMLDADVVARLRRKGINALFANTESHALELIKTVAAPRILEGKKAIIFGRPFDSSSVPAHYLNADYIYKHTGVRLEYRPISELKPLFATANEAEAGKEMERWKREASKIVEPTDASILESSKMYVALRSFIEKEGLDGISIDCLSFSFSENPPVPLPCLAYTRLRDEGITAACEADVCMLISSLFLQEISKRPSFLFNVSEVNAEKSHTILRHCVAPTKLMGADAGQLPFILRDYHGFGRDVVPEVQFPVGENVTIGGFSKDLKEFVLWPGTIQPGVHDMERPSFANVPEDAPARMKNMRRYCSNRVEVKISNVNRFLQSIFGIHQIFVAGDYSKAIYDAATRMNVDIVTPPALTPPEA